MNEVQGFILNFGGTHDAFADINEFLGSKYELIGANVTYRLKFN